jgi:hypothetical protein
MPEHLDSPCKNWFIGALQAGLNVSQAAKENNIQLTTAKNLAEKFRETGSTHCRPGSEQPTKATSRVQQSITKEAKKDQQKPLARVWHGYRKTRGVSKTGNAGMGTVCDFGTPQHTMYPYPRLRVFHRYITTG